MREHWKGSSSLTTRPALLFGKALTSASTARPRSPRCFATGSGRRRKAQPIPKAHVFARPASATCRKREPSARLPHASGSKLRAESSAEPSTSASSRRKRGAGRPCRATGARARPRRGTAGPARRRRCCCARCSATASWSSAATRSSAQSPSARPPSTSTLRTSGTCSGSTCASASKPPGPSRHVVRRSRSPSSRPCRRRGPGRR